MKVIKKNSGRACGRYGRNRNVTSRICGRHLDGVEW